MLNKLMKLNNKNLIITIICIIITIISFYGYGFFRKKSNTPETEPQDYNRLIVDGIDKDNMYVSLDITDIPYQIAERKVNYSYIKYYILYDENDYMYVAKLSDRTYNKIKEEYEKNRSNFVYSLIGYIYKTPNDLKKIIIDVFNEESDEDKISDDTYAQFFGSTYFDDSYTKYTTQTAICEIIAIVCTILLFVFLIKWIVSMVNTRKTLVKVDKKELEEELEKVSLKEYPKARIYLTDRYFISTNKGLHVFNYSDIGWVYVGNKDLIVLPGTKVCLRMYLNNKEKYETKGLDLNNEHILGEILTELATKNSNILIGYNYENMNKYNKTNN